MQSSPSGGENLLREISGDDDGEDTPVPIPNTAVKLFHADDSWTAASCENMLSPDSIILLSSVGSSERLLTARSLVRAQQGEPNEALENPVFSRAFAIYRWL